MRSAIPISIWPFDGVRPRASASVDTDFGVGRHELGPAILDPLPGFLTGRADVLAMPLDTTTRKISSATCAGGWSPIDGRLIANQNSPKCASNARQFRSRRKVTADDGRLLVLDTTYRCKACTRVWTVKKPVKAAG
jgi:hypothetical protein